MTHPSDLRLETFLLAPERSAVAPHVDGCELCQARVAEMRRLGEVFEHAVFPVTAPAVLAAARPPRRPRRVTRWMLAAGPVAAAAALFLFLVVRERVGGPGPHGIDLAVYVQAPSGVRAVRDGAEVPADASVRFEVHPGTPCCLWVLGVDASGEITRLYPPKGDRASEAIVHPARPHELPTGVVLDGRGGPQRFFAVCTKAPVPWLTVKQAAADAMPKGEDAVRSVRSLPGLPAGAVQTTVLVEKRS